MNYILLKSLHVSFVVSSYTLFFLRGIWSWNNSAIMQKRWVKTLPHFVDSFLLLSALSLAFTIHQYPFVNAWLSAKVTALLLYIGLGFIALHNGTNKLTRLIAWLAAQATFAYIVLVAITHNPYPW